MASNPDPFLEYGFEAAKPKRAAPLSGPYATRSKAREGYGGIVTELASCGDRDSLECYLATVVAEIEQFKCELDFLWFGDGEDFHGLEAEIAAAFERVDQTAFVFCDGPLEEGQGQ